MERSRFKVVLVGDGGVGKTSLIRKQLTGKFTPGYDATPGVEIFPVTFRNVTLTCWDTAGQDKLSGLYEGYYIGADAAIVMFDVTSRLSAKNALVWRDKVRRVCETIPIVFCGNKVDCDTVVNADFEYIPISVKTGKNVENLFRCVIEKLT